MAKDRVFHVRLDDGEQAAMDAARLTLRASQPDNEAVQKATVSMSSYLRYAAVAYPGAVKLGAEADTHALAATLLVACGEAQEAGMLWEELTRPQQEAYLQEAVDKIEKVTRRTAKALRGIAA